MAQLIVKDNALIEASYTLDLAETAVNPIGNTGG